MSGIRPAVYCLRALRRTTRLAGIAARRIPKLDKEGPNGDHRHNKNRITVAIGSLGVALLAADHVFNGK